VTTVTIDAAITLSVQQAGEVALCLAVAPPHDHGDLAVCAADGTPAPTRVVLTDGGWAHIADLPATDVEMTYRVEVGLHPAEAAEVSDIDTLVYLRPSRYCPSDRLAGLATDQFGHLAPADAVMAIEAWLNGSLAYVPGVTDAVDDALHPLLARTGVCRDYAHLGVALCRALGIPARYSAAYAPGLSPMDFHAVFEAAIDGRWWVFDGTRLAPRASLVRIATGRDAADTALLTPLGAITGMMSSTLTVTTSGDLPHDDRSSLVALR